MSKKICCNRNYPDDIISTCGLKAMNGVDLEIVYKSERIVDR